MSCVVCVGHSQTFLVAFESRRRMLTSTLRLECVAMLQDGFGNDVWSFGLFLVEVLRPIVNPVAQKTRETLLHLLTE